ncbi:hypothetical protein COCMIDRAFT_9692 [Bipolaris oryzae ATCC 44560]|uniref:Transcription factor domain-containing protein n=1 Tax=Bipolaris oryzae ATCC 44560 TaxID=930090 RepID=W6YXZ3_COCMI|nr:uncharacterized protein COCMIDRAFT_9692 [Bipolaris oryzae ATCC 44560]EUC40429.1 hypothetical protein COCMIDRAFT_9692 [Bipolaris oryzae ATCC 44560]
MARQYEFFVTTTKPHLPNGAERGMIRRLVMRNFFDTKTPMPQMDIPEQSSATTVMARNQLSNRFRIQRSTHDNATKGGKLMLRNGKGRSKGKRRLSPIGTTEAYSMDQITRKGYYMEKDAKERSREGTVESVLKIPKLRIDPSAHRIDPFDILPIPGTRHFDMLFQLYKSAPKTNSIAIDAKNTWPAWAIHDAGLLHATLATWAIYGVLAKGLTELHCCHLKHKSDAINAISSKLTEPDGVVSDKVIGTVLTLANFENLFGAYDTAQMHLMALNQMLTARGGLFAIGHNDGLLRGILWTDFHTAAAFRTPPSFPLVCLDPDAPLLPDELMEEAAYKSPTSPLQLSLAATECFNIFYRLHRIALAMSSHWSGKVSRLTLSNLLYHMQHIVLSVPDRSRNFIEFDREVQAGRNEGEEDQRKRADAASVVEGLLAATLIFVYSALRGLPNNAKIFSILLGRLRIAIDRPGTSVVEVWGREKNLKMLVWVLVVACSIVTSDEDRAWWISKLSDVCGILGIERQVELEDAMQHIAWIDIFFNLGASKEDTQGTFKVEQRHIGGG